MPTLDDCPRGADHLRQAALLAEEKVALLNGVTLIRAPNEVRTLDQGLSDGAGRRHPVEFPDCSSWTGLVPPAASSLGRSSSGFVQVGPR